MSKVNRESRDAERSRQVTHARRPDRPQALNRQSTDGLPSVSEDLKFVNISHPGDIRHRKDIRTEIRRHVMKGIGQQRRRPRPKGTSLQASRTLFLEAGDRRISQLHGADISIVSPSRSLGTFNSFPVEANKRVLELMHFFSTAPYQPFRSVWIEVAICDPGAFHVTLGNAADFLNTAKGNNSLIKSPEVLSHYAASILLLRQRLNSFTESISEGAIANILAHLCLTMRQSDWDSWTVHMDGLSLISRLRGGFADLGPRISSLILL
ncbi:hypothetical protein N7513_005674 [Penicillium frequentans]|nr:hypothetical protein N7513_005674 [Penicillium glabrum]